MKESFDIFIVGELSYYGYDHTFNGSPNPNLKEPIELNPDFVVGKKMNI